MITSILIDVFFYGLLGYLGVMAIYCVGTLLFGLLDIVIYVVGGLCLFIANIFYDMFH